MKKFNFDKWDDNIEITLFEETHKVRLASFDDSRKVAEMQKEMDDLGDNDVADAMIDFVVERFAEAGAKYSRDQFMSLAPAKVIAITRAITQGADDDNPLEGIVT